MDSGNIISDHTFYAQSQDYGGKGSRTFAGRQSGTAVGEHLKNTGHNCKLKEAKILDKEDRVSTRKIKEAIRIHQGRPRTPAWTSQLSSCITLIQKGHLIQTERFCRKFENFFHHNLDSVCRMCDEK